MASTRDDGLPLRRVFAGELEQLRLQVEVIGLKVADALDGMAEVLATGDPALADRCVAADDEVDAMVVSLTERVYDLIGRESPVAGDLRFLVSTLRLLEELERIADLSLRVVKQQPEQPRLADSPAVFAALRSMAAGARDLFRTSMAVWSAMDPALAATLVADQQAMDAQYAVLLAEILALEGRDATRVAVAAVLVGRALERIADHAGIVAERLRWLLTGDPAHLASEVR